MIYLFFFLLQVIPKDADVITVKNISYAEALTSISSANIVIDRHDDGLGTFQTVPIADSRGSTHIFYVRVKDSTAFITGTYNLNWQMGGLIKQNTSFERIRYSGWKTGADKVHFGYMQKFAELFNKELGYSVTKQ